MQYAQHEWREAYTSNEYIEMWLEGAILFQAFKPNTIIDLELGKKIVKDRLRFTGPSPIPIYVDMQQIVSIDRAAREYFASAGANTGLSRMALRGGNIFNSLLARTFIRFSKPPIPARYFHNKQEALEWLRAGQS